MDILFQNAFDDDEQHLQSGGACAAMRCDEKKKKKKKKKYNNAKTSRRGPSCDALLDGNSRRDERERHEGFIVCALFLCGKEDIQNDS